ncbi:MAG: response regulator [Actinomycetales bacterium]|nr:response regulator [Actinomycetales bacterium]
MAQVLLVDDDPDLITRNEAVLVTAGHTVSAVSRPDECLEFVRKHPPDVVVIEAVLQGTPAGLDLARSLSDMSPALPLIVLSDLNRYLSARELAAQDRDGWLPVSRFLEKPVSPEVLADEIDHVLAAAPSRRRPDPARCPE